MDRPPVTLIVARAQNGVIGRDGKLPWHLPADLKRFKAITMGHVLLMGRTTFDSIGRPLPGRRTVVVTRRPDWSAPGVEVAHSIDEALDRAEVAHDLDEARAVTGAEPMSVIGGAEIFAVFLPLADRIELTEVLADVPGDTFIDDPRKSGAWRETSCEEHAAEGGRPPFRFVTLERA